MVQSSSSTQPLLASTEGSFSGSSRGNTNGMSSNETNNADYGSTGSTALAPAQHVKKISPPSPEGSASMYSKITMSWMTSLFKIGAQRPLQEEDVFEMLPHYTTEILGSGLRTCWEEELRKARSTGREPSLLRASAVYILPEYGLAQLALFVA
ncbi:Multidrug resistance-associated protein 4, partial [Lobosporangium transversale]